jgi:hypothetical protein
MNVVGWMGKSASWMLTGAVLLACGGGAKRAPMAPDPTTSPAESASSDDDTMASAWSSDADAGAAAPSAPPAASTASETPSSAAILQGNEDGARALLAQFVAPGADHAALTRSLRPTSSDYKTLFDARTAAKVEAAQSKDWDSNKAVIKPKSGQTETKVWSATGADLARGTGNAREFPPGYKKIAKHLSATVLFFRFKFVEPGKETGTAYDGLAFVNGHWVIAPKPWRALEGKPAAMEEDAEAPPEKPAPKKKPKGGKKKR